MGVTIEYLKDLYYRGLALGLECAEIDGFKYMFKGKCCILKDISLDILNNNSTIFIPDYFDKISLNIQHKDVIGNSKVLIFGKRVSYIESVCFKYSPWIYKVVALGLKKLGNNCFSHSSIYELEAPNLLEIGSDCFRYSSIKLVICPKLKKIGKGCFSECKNLQFIDTKNVIKLESEAFLNCVNLKYLNLRKLSTFRLDSINNCNLDRLELNSTKNIISTYKRFSNEVKYLVIPSDIDNVNKFLFWGINIENLLLCDCDSDLICSFKCKLYSDDIKVGLIEK